MERTISPVAIIHTDFPEKFGVPRQSGRVEELLAEIEILEKFSAEEAFRGIEEYSHLWLIFDFSLSHTDTFSPTVRPPRLGGNKRVGVFATRSPYRPNSLGLSSVKLLDKYKKDGKIFLRVSGADLVDKTPIYDIKPYIPYCDARPDARGSFAEELSDYYLDVSIPEHLEKLVSSDKRQALKGVLSEDPRPSYKEEGDRIYTMSYAELEISFKVQNKTLYVTNIKTADA